MNRNRILSGVFAALVCIAGAQAQGRVDVDEIVAPGPKFNIDTFEQNVRAAVQGKAVGFSYAISQHGQLKKLGQWGWARTDLDVPPELFGDGGMPQDARKRMNIASISKPITAATVHRILQDKMVPGYPNLNLNARVAPFLPKTWTKGPGVATLTFGELLSQYSGMFDNGGATGTDDLEKWIEAGVTRPKDDYKYINANIAIFRILIPYMLSDVFGRAQLNLQAGVDPEAFSRDCANIYKQAVRTLIFEPMGIFNADMRSNDPAPTLLYSVDPNEKGIRTGDWSEVGAGGGWYLSAFEIARFMAHLRYNNSILKPETREKMDDLDGCPGQGCRLMGWQPPILGEHGVYYYHSGSLTYGEAPKSGMRGIAINFPNGVQAVLLVNSIGTYSSVATLMRNAFDNAWEE